MPDFDSIQIGDEAVITRTITEEVVKAFAEFSGDTNAVHMDAKFAKQTRFKQRIAHGMIVTSYFSTVIGTILPGNGSLYLSQDLNFKRPVMIDDIIEIKAKVIQKVVSTRVVVLKTTATNQHSQIVLSGTAKVTWAM